MLTVNTLVADRQSLFCEGLKCVLATHPIYSINVSHVVSSSEEVLNLLGNEQIDCVILDLNLDVIDGFELISQIRKSYKQVKLLVLTAYNDHNCVKEAMKSGADGYMLKSNDKVELFNAISTILEERTYLGTGVFATPRNTYKSTKEIKPKFEDRFMIKRKLTKRENEVLGLITQAKNNKEIAKELFISDQTVGVHRKNIMKKLGVRNTVNLIKYAFENQLV